MFEKSPVFDTSRINCGEGETARENGVVGSLVLLTVVAGLGVGGYLWWSSQVEPAATPEKARAAFLDWFSEQPFKDDRVKIVNIVTDGSGDWIVKFTIAGESVPEAIVHPDGSVSWTPGL